MSGSTYLYSTVFTQGMIFGWDPRARAIDNRSDKAPLLSPSLPRQILYMMGAMRLPLGEVRKAQCV
jgi:hypothetical protein